LITTTGLTKRYGTGVLAVDSISFTARPGEVFGLLGENGAGKTTTLRMLATVLRPTSGTAEVMGYDLLNEPQQVRRHIGVVAAETGVYDRLTPYEIVQYFGRLNDLDEATIRSRAREIFERLDMTGFADRRSGQLSKGMKQKVNIARAMINNPSVLLLDEPCAGLDVTSSRAVDDFILEAKREGKTILFSSHIMSEVEKICDRVAIIHRGSIIVEGTLDELKGRQTQAKFEDIFVRLVGEGR